MSRGLLLALLAALPACAQIQLFQFDGTNENAVGSIYQLAPAAPGDNILTTFRVRNTGPAAVTLTTLSIAGASLSITTKPGPAYIIAPTAFVEFQVLFSPTAAGSYSANLQVNSLAVLVRGTAVASVVLSQGATQLGSGATVDFGKTQFATTVTQSFTLSNPSSSPLTVSSVTLSGTGFQGPTGITAPLTLNAGQSAPFQIAFTPPAAQTYTATLSIDQRTFKLTGLGLAPPLPKASIQLDPTANANALQSKLSIALASQSQVSGTGTLTMVFHPSVSGVSDDPAVLFLSGPARVATVTIAPGESVGHFGSSTTIGFQTGTTAGTIVFTLVFPNDTEQASIIIAPAPITLNTASGTRSVNSLAVTLVGFDNTYSASQMKFTFYDAKGTVLAPGPIAVDSTQGFHTYFASGQAGGAFALLATFPVTGDPTVVIGVDVAITNSAGVTQTQRLTF